MHAADQAMYRARALTVDDSIRVIQANGAQRSSGADTGGHSNVVNLPAPGPKSQIGSSLSEPVRFPLST